MTDKVKQRIHELVPEVMELKFGCEVKLDGIQGTVLYYDLGGRSFDGENTEYFEGQLGFFNENGEYSQYGDGTDNSMPRLREIEVLGSPITLAFVLRAIHLGDELKRIKDEVNRSIPLPVVTSSGYLIFNGAYAQWDLTKDYDDQTQKTKDFIGKLLGV